jgi:excisionase family DNA binding protein
VIIFGDKKQYQINNPGIYRKLAASEAAGNEVAMVIAYDPTPMLTVKDVAKLLNVHVNTVRRWSNSHIIKSYRITRRGDRRFRREDIANFLASYDKFNAKKGKLQDSFEYAQNVEVSRSIGERSLQEVTR